MSDLPDSSSERQSHEGYVLPAENAAEMARLMLQDHLLTQIMGGSLPEQPDLSSIHRVLDVACGPGGWLLDLGTQYPQVQGIGIDISELMTEYATSLAISQNVSNVQFRVMDATGPLDFPDNTFDLVNGRILMGFLATQQWPGLLKECHRITQPGGILRLTEPEWAFTNSAAFDKLAGLAALAMHRAHHTFSPSGRTFGTASVLRLLLRRAGYQNIQYRANAADFSAGTEIHTNYIQDILVVYKLIEPFVAMMQVATQEELTSLYAQMEVELQAEDFCGVDYYLTVWGRKP
ncbi:MAG: methyltransferase domain-containing protein [Chloroflexi bacterium]|nr:methyltransferase domain-containing protein [Chloroflexota bacterium]